MPRATRPAHLVALCVESKSLLPAATALPPTGRELGISLCSSSTAPAVQISRLAFRIRWHGTVVRAVDARRGVRARGTIPIRIVIIPVRTSTERMIVEGCKIEVRRNKTNKTRTAGAPTGRLHRLHHAPQGGAFVAPIRTPSLMGARSRDYDSPAHSEHHGSHLDCRYCRVVRAQIGELHPGPIGYGPGQQSALHSHSSQQRPNDQPYTHRLM
jgi:hypothetical protein